MKCADTALRHLLFDFDGTLVDSDALHEACFRSTLSEFEPELLSGFVYSRYKGMVTRSVFATLGIGSEERNQFLTTEKQLRYRNEVAAGRLQLVPGAMDILVWGQTNGMRQFIVTGGSGRALHDAMEATRIGGFIEGSVTGDDVKRGKPAPDSYLECMRRFGLAAGECLAIEDALAGARAARSAGLRVVGIRDAEVAGACDMWFAGLPELQSELSRIVLLGLRG
ncbi:HAD-IA family hydrolase [uncultured Paludibaculum sp.]|uniref:HAD family hydrolase n=1 Tax=uncultured Paludibaculum sp. TaxID=1765020 RepID=UPI002AABE8DF|nr:HAD-IA family hydrolase [uncultured Paludibaculum sp.]